MGYAGCMTFTFLLVIAIPVWIMLSLAAKTGPKQETAGPADTDPPKCLIMGYSTAGDGGLRRIDPKGALYLLNDRCAPCAEHTDRISWFGGTLPLVRDYLCSPSAQLTEGTQIVFLGGTNDDSMGGVHEHDIVHAFRFSPMFIFFSVIQLTVHHGLSVYVDLNTHDPDLRPDQYIYKQTLQWASEQSEQIHDILACTKPSGATFWFFQNFLLSDVYLGRYETKQQLVDIRKNAFETSGGIFIDMFSELKNQVGVSWFNDTEHLSGIGYEAVTELMCRYLSDDKIGRRSTNGADMMNRSVSGIEPVDRQEHHAVP